MPSLFENRCKYCEAFYWPGEANQKRVYNGCCEGGSIQLPTIQPPNALMQELLSSTTKRAKVFQKKIRSFNTALAFASCTFKKEDFQTKGPPVVVVRGNIMHSIGSLFKDPERVAAYMQCYFYEEGENEDNQFFKWTKAEV